MLQNSDQESDTTRNATWSSGWVVSFCPQATIPLLSTRYISCRLFGPPCHGLNCETCWVGFGRWEEKEGAEAAMRLPIGRASTCGLPCQVDSWEASQRPRVTLTG